MRTTTTSCTMLLSILYEKMRKGTVATLQNCGTWKIRGSNLQDVRAQGCAVHKPPGTNWYNTCFRDLTVKQSRQKAEIFCDNLAEAVTPPTSSCTLRFPTLAMVSTETWLHSYDSYCTSVHPLVYYIYYSFLPTWASLSLFAPVNAL